MMLPPATRVYLACGFTDMRKGFDGLAALVQDQVDVASLSFDSYEKAVKQGVVTPAKLAEALEKRLCEFEGIGPKTVEIFMREAAAVLF